MTFSQGCVLVRTYFKEFVWRFTIFNQTLDYLPCSAHNCAAQERENSAIGSFYGANKFCILFDRLPRTKLLPPNAGQLRLLEARKFLPGSAERGRSRSTLGCVIPRRDGNLPFWTSALLFPLIGSTLLQAGRWERNETFRSLNANRWRGNPIWSKLYIGSTLD